MNDFEEKKKNTKDQANELERIEAMTFCVRGGVLIKYGRRGKPHGAEFKFSSDGRALEWQNIKKKTKKKKTKNDEREYDFENEAERNGGKGASTSKRASSFYNGSNTSTLQLRLDVVKVTKGRDSAIFDRFPNLHDEKCSFFIEYVEGGGGENDVVANIKSGVAKNTQSSNVECSRGRRAEQRQVDARHRDDTVNRKRFVLLRRIFWRDAFEARGRARDEATAELSSQREREQTQRRRRGGV